VVSLQEENPANFPIKMDNKLHYLNLSSIKKIKEEKHYQYTTMGLSLTVTNFIYVKKIKYILCTIF